MGEFDIGFDDEALLGINSKVLNGEASNSNRSYPLIPSPTVSYLSKTYLYRDLEVIECAPKLSLLLFL